MKLYYTNLNTVMYLKYVQHILSDKLILMINNKATTEFDCLMCTNPPYQATYIFF